MNKQILGLGVALVLAFFIYNKSKWGVGETESNEHLYSIEFEGTWEERTKGVHSSQEKVLTNKVVSTATSYEKVRGSERFPRMIESEIRKPDAQQDYLSYRISKDKEFKRLDITNLRSQIFWLNFIETERQGPGESVCGRPTIIHKGREAVRDLASQTDSTRQHTLWLDAETSIVLKKKISDTNGYTKSYECTSISYL